MWSINNLLAEAEAAKERIASAIGQPKSPEKNTSLEPKPTIENDSSHFSPTIAAIPTKNEEVLHSLKSSWTNFTKATQNVTQNAIQNIEREQARLFQKGPYKRDLSLPLDTVSLRDAEVVYITDRLITMGHPAMQSAVDGDITPDRKLAAVAHLLQKRHGGKFMVWNLSELEYDYSVLDEQVMTFEFPGSPSPPLGMLMKILLSLESWLKADEKNVAVMHCLTGRGRTSTVMSSFLCWMGEAGFVNPNRALEYMAQCKKSDLETLTIPSQRRYVGYFSNMLDGVRPSQPPLVLKRIIMSEAPKVSRTCYVSLQNYCNSFINKLYSSHCASF
jgi:tensin